MLKTSKFAPLLFLATSAQTKDKEFELSALVADQCIWLDPFGVSGMMVFMPEGGEWISDYKLLETDWQHGWDMRALNYCVDPVAEGGKFRSMQVVLGHEDVKGDKEYPLHKHGGPGGDCYEWRLPDHDYVTKVQYQFDWVTGFVDSVHFVTATG